MPEHAGRVRVAAVTVGVLALMLGVAAAPKKTRQLRVVPHEGGVVQTVGNARILCGTRCLARFPLGKVVELDAVPGADWSFVDWHGTCVGTAPTCVLAMTRASSLRPSFARIPEEVDVVVGGPGRVSTESGTLNCPGACSATFGRGSTLELIAAPLGSEIIFRGWGGACAGASTVRCSLIVQPSEVTAAFGSRFPPPGESLLTVSSQLTSQPPGINCPPTCQAQFPNGTLVTLAPPYRGFRPPIWFEACRGEGTRCTLFIDAPTSAFAVHPPPPAPPPPQAFVDVTTSGPGMVVGPGLRCGGASTACSVTLSPHYGTPVQLVARPRRGARFGGWRGTYCDRSRRLRCEARLQNGERMATSAFFRP